MNNHGEVPASAKIRNASDFEDDDDTYARGGSESRHGPEVPGHIVHCFRIEQMQIFVTTTETERPWNTQAITLSLFLIYIILLRKF